MPKPAKGARLGSGPAHEKLLLSGLAADLFREERIRTTEAKAKRLRPVAEKLITMGKSGTVHSRRQALAAIEDRDVIHKLFSDIGPRFAERQGGYTRILKLGPRQGDAAPMAIIELLEGSVEEQDSAQPESRKRRLRRRRAGGKGVSRAPIENEADEADQSADQAEDGAAEVAAPKADATADTPSAEVEAPAAAGAEAETPVVGAESPAEPEEAPSAETAPKDEA